MSSSVYWIHHPEHTDMFSQGYIGVSKDAEKRWNNHRKHQANKHFANAVKLYGWDFLVKKQILIAEEDYCLDIEQKLRSTKNVGWNIAVGGGKPPVAYGHKRLFGNKINKNRKHSVETRQKRSDLNKLRFQDPVAREKFSKAKLGSIPWNKGKKASPETIEKQRLAHIGKPSGRKGKPNSLTSIVKLKATFQANPWTCPHCNKIGFNKGSGNRWHFNNCKEKICQAQ